jgi:transcriptional regulator with AAA-type ATPase domain
MPAGSDEHVAVVQLPGLRKRSEDALDQLDHLHDVIGVLQ